MKHILVTAFLFSTFAYAECLPPNKTTISISQQTQAAKSNQQNIYFSGYSLQLDPSNGIIFAKDMMSLLYGESKKSDKYIAFQTSTDKKLKEVLLNVFNLNEHPKQEAEVFENIRASYGLCNGEITQYTIQGLPQMIVKYTATPINPDEKNVFVYIFDHKRPSFDMLVFMNFSEQKITNILATLHKVP